jgi:hypothetical protein
LHQFFFFYSPFGTKYPREREKEISKEEREVRKMERKT